MALCATLAMSTSMSAQQQQTPALGLEELIPGGATHWKYVPKSIYGLQWWGDTCILPSDEDVTAVNPATGRKTQLFTLDEINSALAAKNLGKLFHFSNATYPYPDKKIVVLQMPKHVVEYDFGKKEIVSVVTPGDNADNWDFCPASNILAYTVGDNLFVAGTDGKTHAVTNETKDGIVCGKSVHREEFGITKGTFWSPKGHLLAFYRMDESMVAQYPLVDIDTRIATVQNIRYPMAGMTSHKVSIGIYNPATGQTVFLKTCDPTDRYFTNISWSPDEKKIYVIELNRGQNHSQLICYNAITGEKENILYEETNAKYVEPLHPLTFLPWNSNQFIYQSQKDGFNHLYIFNTAGKQLCQLTKGKWLVQNIDGFNAGKKTVLITTTGISSLQSNAAEVDMKGHVTYYGTCRKGVEDMKISKSGKYAIDSYSSPSVPHNIDLVTVASKKAINLFKAPNPYEGISMPSITLGTIKAADGVTDLYYRMVKPNNFDPNKKYPVIIYVYGGPHAQMIHNNWMYDVRGWDLYMAEKGYIMFTLDNRGSENRGFGFESCTFHHLGVEECKDQMKGVEFLKSLPYVDGNRMGIHGWSFGGHMTVAMMLRHPGVFKAAVAGGPVIDWKYYEVMYGERYMGTPQNNPEGYKETDLKNLAGNLKDHLLIIHDYNDKTCVPQHSFSFLKACVEARTYPDFFTYPDHEHNVLGRDRVHLHEKITRYFEDYLK